MSFLRGFDSPRLHHEVRQSMIQWAAVLFIFLSKKSLYQAFFRVWGVQKSSMLGFFYFTEAEYTHFAAAAKVLRFEKSKIGGLFYKP